MLTAGHEIADRVAGLDAGADDYLVKPFALDDSCALEGAAASVERLRLTTSALRGSRPRTPGSRVRTLSPLELTKTEFDLLSC